MKKITLIIGLVAFSTIVRSQNGLEKIIVEKYYVSNAADAAGSEGVLPVGSVTYRVYADMLPGYCFRSLYGNEIHALKINTTTKFFNNEDRGAITPNGIASTQLKNNTVALDSWLSVGASATGQFGVLKSDDNGVDNLVLANTLLKNNVADMGIPLTSQDGNMAGSPMAVTLAYTTGVGVVDPFEIFNATSQAGNSIDLNNHAISALGGAVGPTNDNRILLGQFTTDGVFTFELNLQIGKIDEDLNQYYVAKNPTGNEISISSLILAPNSAPTISITAPSTASVGESVTIEATASDVDGTISQVEFFVDNVSIGVDASAPYTVNWTALLGSHAIKAIAKDNLGSMTSSSISTIQVQTVGLNEFTASNFSVNVSPNPAKDLISINIKNVQNNENTKVSFFDFKGSFISETNLPVNSNDFNYKLDVSNLKSGIYFMNVSSGNEIITEKIVIE